MSKKAAQKLAEKNVLTRPAYDALEAAARAKALTVAGISATETLTKIRDVLAQNVEKGANRAAFRKAVLEAVGEGTFLSKGHLETVFRANVQGAFSDGQMEVLSNPLVQNQFPYSAYDSIHDERARPEHNSLDARGIGGSNVYRNDDPVFQLFRPPWDYNCRCSWTPLTVRQAARRGVKEAEEWQRTGVPPSNPAYVNMPPFQPSPGFQRAVSGAPFSIQLSLQPMMGFAPTQPTPIIIPITPDEYPRNRSNHFVSKYDIVECLKDQEEYNALRDSLPESEQPKLDNMAARLTSGQLIHEPNEDPGLAIDRTGWIPDTQWNEYDYQLRQREEWEQRDEEREAWRMDAVQFVKLLRSKDHAVSVTKQLGTIFDKAGELSVSDVRALVEKATDDYESFLDELDDKLDDAGATDEEVRSVSRMRRKNYVNISGHVEAYVAQYKRATKDNEDKVQRGHLTDRYEDLERAVRQACNEITELYEDVAESIFQRIEAAEKNDPEPDIPEEPKPSRAALSTDAGGREHRGKGKGGGQFVSSGGHNEDEKYESEHDKPKGFISKLLNSKPIRVPYEKIQEWKAAVESRATQIIDKIPGGKRAREKVAQIKQQLTDRYGEKTMGAIITTSMAISWGAMGLGAVLGKPIWIPSVAIMIPALVLAESHHQIKKQRPDGIAASAEDSGITLSEEEIEEIARSVVKQLEEITDNATAFGMVGDEWHGKNPPGEGWIPAPDGPRGGKRWRRDGRQRLQVKVKGQGDGSESGRSGPVPQGVKGGGSPVAETPPRPEPDEVGGTGESTDSPTRPEVARSARTPRGVGARINERVTELFDHFSQSGQTGVADWLGSLRDEINKPGAQELLSMLRPETISPNNHQTVAYKGTGYFDPKESETKFIKDYLKNVGVVLRTTNHGSKKVTTLTSAPINEELRKKYNLGTNVKMPGINTKLEESKLLPGLESSEDIDKVTGRKVSHFTPDVIKKLDQQYGKGKWLVKAYGDEAYAGFGIFFPQRIAQIQRDAQETMRDTDNKLRKLGYSLARNEQGTAIGLLKTGNNQPILFGSRDFNNLSDERVRRLGNVAAVAANDEHGTSLPFSSEDNLKQRYNIAVRKNDKGKIVGITDYNGYQIDFNTPEYEQFEDDNEAAAYEVDRAVSWGGEKGDVGFMVQPAFPVVGVTEADRALGLTWETGREGRVHVITDSKGKVSVVPYATLAGRQDTVPVVFADQEIRDMERAAQEAINNLPPKLRNGQVYAPDMIRTADGWRAVELNASVETGSSAWLEQNPMVIDAYVSHLTGRDPAHVQFVRSLLKDKLQISPIEKPIDSVKIEGEKKPRAEKKINLRKFGAKREAAFGMDAQGHQHRGKGKGGGQFVSQGKSSSNDTSTRSNTKVKEGDDEEWKPKREETRTVMDAIFDIADMFGIAAKKVKLIHKGLKEADAEYNHDTREADATQDIADNLSKATELLDKRLSSGQPLPHNEKTDLFTYVYEASGRLDRADPFMYYSSPAREFLQRLLIWVRKNA